MSNKKILIVDDNRTCRDVLGLKIEMITTNVAVITKSNVRDALSFCKWNVSDLIFSDLEMPVMTGYDFLREFREINKTTPVVVYSGNAYTVPPEGFADTLGKPFIVDDLRRILMKFI